MIGDKEPKNIEEAKISRNEKLIKMSENHIDSITKFIKSKQPNIKTMKLITLSINILEVEFVEVNKRIAENQFKFMHVNTNDSINAQKLLDKLFVDLMETTIITQSIFLLFDKFRDMPKEEFNQIVNDVIQSMNKDKINNDKQYDNNNYL